MKNRPSLVVLAAGLGSRYGSLKQIDKFGPFGETIVDYAIYDAVKAGFEKIIFVIRESIEEEFKSIFLNKLRGIVQVEYVTQELNVLPKGFEVPFGREKPWGTAHAVMTTKSKINEPFAIVNADDFYGRESLRMMYNHLSQIDNSKYNACLIGFVLKNTLSDNGRVSRGVCKVSNNQILENIIERTHIYRGRNSQPYYIEDDKEFKLTGNEIVSMNLMGFTFRVFEIMDKMFKKFLTKHGDNPSSEFFIPTVLDELRLMGVKIPVITSKEKWFGVTYKEDKSVAKERLMNLINKGIYPENLWNR